MPLSTIAEAQARATNSIKHARRATFLARFADTLIITCIVLLMILLFASFIGCIVSIMDQGHYKWMGILLIGHVCVVVTYGILSFFSQDMIGSLPRVVVDRVKENRKERDEVCEGGAEEDEVM
ncbi:hypothetical protein EG327_007149 [Venturia inaequalis]|uniref:Uncharacterized protein n=2 Tax=Venturia inaequalis TaxID=5025 RepID=A0A8H3Z3A7_VENIN|nr:hypothetical protein EG327_007149 [Venturia inaequalis]